MRERSRQCQIQSQEPDRESWLCQCSQFTRQLSWTHAWEGDSNNCYSQSYNFWSWRTPVLPNLERACKGLFEMLDQHKSPNRQHMVTGNPTTWWMLPWGSTYREYSKGCAVWELWCDPRTRLYSQLQHYSIEQKSLLWGDLRISKG